MGVQVHNVRVPQTCPWEQVCHLRPTSGTHSDVVMAQGSSQGLPQTLELALTVTCESLLVTFTKRSDSEVTNGAISEAHGGLWRPSQAGALLGQLLDLHPLVSCLEPNGWKNGQSGTTWHWVMTHQVICNP